MMLAVSLWQHFLDPLSGDCFNRQYVSLKNEGFPDYVENISTQGGQDHSHFVSGFAPRSSKFHAGSLLCVSPKPGERLCAFTSEVCSCVVLPDICKLAYVVVVLG